MSSKPAEKTSPQGRTAEKAPVEEPVPDLPSAPAPAGFGQGSDLLEAMEIRIDSLSVALHRLEARHASVERMLERMTGLSPTEVSEDQAVPRLDETSTKTSAGLPASPRPTTPRPISPRRGRGWIALAVGLLLGALAALVATYIGVGTEAQLSIDEIFSASSPPIDFRSLLSSVTWMSAAVGLGVAFLVFLLTIAIRRGPAR